jgi:hypothetical protein
MIKRLGLVIALAAALGVSGCGDDGGNPNPPIDLGNLFPDAPQNPCAGCQGCCQSGQCLPGTTISACGFGGLTCQTCNPTDQCLNGTCVPQQPSCSPSTCAQGCCNAQGSCVTPTDENNCGVGASACQKCATGEVCTAAGKCDTAAPKSYAVVVNSCEITKNCDTIGKCDAYAEVALGDGAVVKTPIVNDKLPVWDFKLFDATDNELTTKKLKVRILDDEQWPLSSEEMGVCEISITAQALAAGSLTTSCGADVKDLKFSFTPK